MGQAKLRKQLGIAPAAKPIFTQDAKIDEYLKRRLQDPRHFARTGWQTWLYLALHHPESFPIELQQFLDTCVSPIMLPVPFSNLDGMMHSYYRVYETRMFSSTLAAWGETPPEQTYEQLREKRWEKMISSMSTQLHRILINKVGQTISSAKKVENENIADGGIQ